MPRVSTIEDKTPYQLRREELGLSREQASELLEVISPERIERIESRKYIAHPDEVMIMTSSGWAMYFLLSMRSIRSGEITSSNSLACSRLSPNSSLLS